MKLNSLFLIPLLLLFLLAPAHAREAEIRGVWIHTYGPFDWDTEMKKVADAGFNTVFFRVARGVNALYPSQFLARDDWAATAPHDEMQRAIAAAHRNGLEFHAWKVCFHAGGAARQKGEARVLYEQMERDDRLVRGLDGQQGPYLNPADPRNQQLELDVLREITEKYNVDGVHLDYIRYPDDPHFDFDYGAVSRREFEQHIGHPVRNWPRDVHSGELKWDYENWERENINKLVQRVYAQAKTQKPRVQVSAAVWRAHRSHRATVKQDWIYWAKNGWLDFVVPMNYTKDDNQFRGDVRSQVANSAGKVLLAAGIGNYQHETPEPTLQQIEIARSEGADGYVLFDYRAGKYDALLAALKTGPHFNRSILPFQIPQLKAQTVRLISIGGHRFTLKDRPPIHLANTNHTEFLELKIPSELDGYDVSGNIVLEDLQERVLGTLATLDLKAGEKRAWKERLQFPMPINISRVVFRGELSREGVARSFVSRGPLNEGVIITDFQKLFTQHYENQRPVLTRSVAIYAGGMADQGIEKVLLQNENSEVRRIHRLQRRFWQELPVLVLPQLRDVEEFSPQVVTDLREWVAGGGILLLTHDAVGFRWHLRAFPEIGEGVALSKTRDVEVLPNEFGFTPGKWQHEYPDHVTIAPGPAGRVLARNAEGAPVFVGGDFGKGKVLLYGSLLGYAPGGVLGAGETQLLHDLMKSHAETQRR